MELKELCSTVAEMARTLGRELMQKRAEMAFDVMTKGRNDFVTTLDKYSEQTLVQKLSELLPEAGFIAEEGTRTDRADRYNWVVDPIDGTTNFIHGVPPFAISIGLLDGDEITLGVVYEMSRDELFAAYKGGGATLNGKPIHVSTRPTVADALITMGFPYANFSRAKGLLQAIDVLMRTCHGLRRLGSAATDLCYIACGRFDAYFEYDLKPYDVAGGSIILTEAGGKVSDYRRGKDYIFGKEMLASNGLIHSELEDIIDPLLSITNS
ncbi:MAG: inositol monophosphatase [Bacteroidales bacterium]|nr:inositol monophosphatase [Bacteroidales bacterium]